MYLMAKHLHLTLVVISLAVFLTRVGLTMNNAAVLQRKWAKITPHVIDTMLLLSAAWLCVMLAQYPFVQAWVTYKLIGILVYIGLGVFVLKRAQTNWQRLLGAVAVIVLFAGMAHIALAKGM